MTTATAIAELCAFMAIQSAGYRSLYVNGRALWPALNQTIASSPLLSPASIAAGHAKTGDTEQAMRALMSPTEFATVQDWLNIWVMISSVHHLTWGATEQDAIETAHNGAIFGHVISNAWWVDYTTRFNPPPRSRPRRMKVRSLERGARGDQYGADLMLAYPTRPGYMKVLLLQAKRIRENGRINLSQKHGGGIEDQIEVLVYNENLLLTLAGRYFSARVSSLFDAGCYYLVWDRRIGGRAPFTPIIRSAGEALQLRNARNRRASLAFHNASDFALMTALHYLHGPSLVGVEVPISNLLDAFKERRILPSHILLIGCRTEGPVGPGEWSAEQAEDGENEISRGLDDLGYLDAGAANGDNASSSSSPLL